MHFNPPIPRLLPLEDTFSHLPCLPGSVSLGLKTLTPSQLGLSFPSFRFLEGIQSGLFFVAAGVVQTAIAARQGALVFLPLQELFQLRSCYKNLASEASLGISRRFLSASKD